MESGRQVGATAWWAAWAVGILAVAAYANSLRNEFVWDDPITLSRQLVVFDSLGAVLLPPSGIPQFSPDYYRPVVIASYLLDRALGGGTPLAFHCSLVLMHATVSVLVLLLGLRLFADRQDGWFGALAAGALFAVHPIHTESVAWMAGRSDVLATGFLLAALVVHAAAPLAGVHSSATAPSTRPVKSKRKRKARRRESSVTYSRAPWVYSLATGVLVFCALGSKEPAVTVFPLLVAYDWLFHLRRGMQRPSLPGWLRRYAGPAIAGVLYLLLRRATLGEFVGTAPGESSPYDSLSGVVGALGLYLSKLVFPIRLNAYIDTVPTGFSVLVLTSLVLVVCLAVVVWLFRRGQPVPVFSLAWFGLTIAPSLTIIWKIAEAPVAERYLYLPSVGLCLMVGHVALLGWSATWNPRISRFVTVAMLGILLMAGLVGTVVRNRVWRDNMSLWSDCATKSRKSGMPFRSLGAEYLRQGRYEEARGYLEEALRLRNSKTGLLITHNNLGTLAMGEGDYEAAEREYRHALEVDSNAPDSLFNLGLAIFQRGDGTPEAARAALPYYRRAASLSPHDPDVEAALGQALSLTGDREGAARHMRRALELGVRPETAAGIRVYLERLGEAP